MASPFPDAGPERDRRLVILERLLAIEATELKPTLDEASSLLAQGLGVDKVDVFLHESATDTLVALGTSDTSMGVRQHAIGMNRVPLANGGRTVQVFQTGRSFISGRLDLDPEELKGVVEGLGARSGVASALDVAGERRGVLQALSEKPDAFAQADVPFWEAVSRWVGMVAHRAEMVEKMTAAAVEQGRRAASEELISLLTPRQREIAALISAGLTNEQIAARLVLTKGTVANHVEHILDRLGASRRTQVAALVAELGLHRVDGTQ